MRWSPPADGGRAALACSLALTAFLLAWAALHADWWQEVELVDTPTYEAYGDAIVRGEVPYRDFVPEYPPLALPAFVVPSLVVGADASQERYATAFDVDDARLRRGPRRARLVDAPRARRIRGCARPAARVRRRGAAAARARSS